MQATEIERSPGLPSSMVTTRRRLMPQGTPFSFLQAVTQALHSMQRSASTRNFARAFPLSAMVYTSCYAGLIEHRVALVSCICVTESYPYVCLLYTSDAADDLLCVDL